MPVGSMLTVRQVAKDLGVCMGTVYNEIRDGNLQAHRFRGCYRISEQALADYKERCFVGCIPDPNAINTIKHLKI